MSATKLAVARATRGRGCVFLHAREGARGGESEDDTEEVTDGEVCGGGGGQRPERDSAAAIRGRRRARLRVGLAIRPMRGIQRKYGTRGLWMDEPLMRSTKAASRGRRRARLRRRYAAGARGNSARALDA